MSKFHAPVIAIWVGATLYIAPRPAAAGGQAPERTLTLVVMDDSSGARASDVAAAQSFAGRVFAQVGVRAVWQTRQEFGAAMPVAPASARAYCESVIFVRLGSVVPPNPTVLGKALTDSNIVWAYLPRIEEAARAAGEPVADFLGYVIAHEVGHILIGGQAHTPLGIMAVRINVDAVRRRSLGFLPEQAVRMHKWLEALALRAHSAR